MKQRILSKRKPAFCWAANDAIATLVESLQGPELLGALGVYQGLTYLASLSRDGDHEGFDATRTEIADACGLSTRRLGQHISRLTALHLLQVDVGGGSRPNTWSLVDPPQRLALPDETSGGTKRQGETERQGDHRTKRRGALHIEEVSEGSEVASIEATSSHVSAARRVFDAWLESTGRDQHRTRFSSERRRLIERRLRSYPVEELLAAVRGWRHSPHHRGENTSRKAYNDLGLLLRDADHIEMFRDLELKALPRPRDPLAELAVRAA